MKNIVGIQTGLGKQLIYDTISGRLFYANINRVKSEFDSLMQIMNCRKCKTTLNDFYEAINLPTIEAGEMLEICVSYLSEFDGIQFNKIDNDPLSSLNPYYAMYISEIKPIQYGDKIEMISKTEIK